MRPGSSSGTPVSLYRCIFSSKISHSKRKVQGKVNPADMSEKRNRTSSFNWSTDEYAVAQKDYNRKSPAERLVACGIALMVLAVAASLFLCFRPFTLADVRNAAGNLSARASSLLSELAERKAAGARNALGIQKTERVCGEETVSEEDQVISSLERTGERGMASAFNAEPISPPEDEAIYTCMLDTVLGPMLYYNQGDIRWRDYLYGGADPIRSYGCGPTCVAMVINSFGSDSVTPVEMADWSAANGGYAPQSGSYHSLIPESIAAFGLQVESVTDRSVENAASLLDSGHLLIALMGKGSLTQNGHFIVIIQLGENGNVYIADPASYDNSIREWELSLLMNELKGSYDSGGPLWAVSLP